MSKAWIEQKHAFGNVSPFLQFQPSVHFPAFQVCIGRSIGCQSPHQTLACTLLLISDVTRLQVVEYIHICTFQNTYLQLQTLSLLFHVTVTSPLAMPPPCHGPQTHNVPGQPQYHTESRSWKPTFSWLSPTWVRKLTAGFAEGGTLMREKQLP